MRSAVVAFCSFWIVAGIVVAQQQQPPVFRGGVELVTLDVTVVDKAGVPVKGLTPDDFVVSLDGQTRPVRVLDFLEFGSSDASDAVPAPASREVTNQQSRAAARRGGRVFLIVFDDLSCRPMQAKGLTIAAERMLATLDPDDLVGLVTTSGLGPVVQPTRDRALVLAGLKNKKLIGRSDDNPSPRFYIGVNEALDISNGVFSTLKKVIERECAIKDYDPTKPVDEICPNLVEADGRHLGELTVHRAAMQMAAYRAVITAMKTAPKPRVIVALSSGVATSVRNDLKEQTDSISRAAVEAGVQFYALTEMGDEFDMSLRGTEMDRREENTFLHSGIQTVASAAGGETFLVVGTADRFFTRIERETSGFYRLGVEAPVESSRHRLLNAKVAVRKAGVTIRTNPHALMDSVAPDAISVDERLKDALAQGGASFGVPIALATALRRDPAASAAFQLGVNVQVPAIVPGPLVAMFALVNEAGQIVQEGRKQVAQAKAADDYLLTLPVPLGPGRYRLRFVVADAGGNVGGLEQPVTASLQHFGSFTVSELFTSWAASDGVTRFLALETVPDAAATVSASLELYPDQPTTARDVTVRLALLQAGATSPIVERDLTPAGAGTTRTLTASLPVDQLAPGAYVIRATTIESGSVTGTVTTVIRKKGPGGL